MYRPLRVAVLAMLAAASLALPSAAAAQTTVTLTGETLNSSLASTVDIQCGATAADTSTVTYDAVGDAIGPYPGTFTEHATVTFHNGAVDTFSAGFTIDSPETGTTITGTKELNPNELALGATCGPADPFPEKAQVFVPERYQATISSLLGGTFSETGRATTNLTAFERPPLPNALNMQQSFQSGGPPGVTITISPKTSTNPTGTSHTVTAIVRDMAGNPVQGETVIFTITGSSGQQGRCVTDVNGVCNYSYVGPDHPGADEITACADTNVNGAPDAGEPCDVATKAWSPAAATPGGAHGGGYISADQISFGFSAQTQSPTDPVHGSCSVIDHALGVHIKCTDITSLLLAGTHATFFGAAEQDGIATNFQIDVDDLTGLGLPDTFKIKTDLGYVAGGPLTHGNINVRP